MAKLKVTKSQLINFILERQALVKRINLLPENHRELKQFGVFHTTNQTTPFLSLLARVESFKEKHNSQFIKETLSNNGEERIFYRLRCMRGTLHLIPVDFISLFRKVFLEQSETVLKGHGIDVTHEEIHNIRLTIIQHLQENGPSDSRFIKKLIYSIYNNNNLKNNNNNNNNNGNNNTNDDREKINSELIEEDEGEDEDEEMEEENKSKNKRKKNKKEGKKEMSN